MIITGKSASMNHCSYGTSHTHTSDRAKRARREHHGQTLEASSIQSPLEDQTPVTTHTQDTNRIVSPSTWQPRWPRVLKKIASHYCYNVTRLSSIYPLHLHPFALYPRCPCPPFPPCNPCLLCLLVWQVSLSSYQWLQFTIVKSALNSSGRERERGCVCVCGWGSERWNRWWTSVE